MALHLLYMYYVLPRYIVNMNIHDVNNDHVHLCIAYMYMNTCAGTSARQQQLSAYYNFITVFAPQHLFYALHCH